MTKEVIENMAEEFLRRHGMFYAQIDMEAELQKLLRSMEKDFREEGRSGRMIPNYIGDYRPPAGEKKVTVIDIGGTNVRCAVLVMGPEGVKKICSLITFLTPGVAEETDTAGFYGQIAEGVKDNLVTDEIGICFSLATIPQKDRDAIMVAGGKQIRIRDMLGKKVGVSFRQAMAERGLDRGQRITVVNDTVAAALGGQAYSCQEVEDPGLIAENAERSSVPCAQHPVRNGKDSKGSTPTLFAGRKEDTPREYESHMGFIYGTGINLCCRVKTGEWVNTEAAAYNDLPTGDLDDAFDAGLIDTGCDRLEKMVSGGYQGGLMGVILEKAADEGLIARETYDAMFFAQETKGAVGRTGCTGPAEPGKEADRETDKGVDKEAVKDPHKDPHKAPLTAKDISTFAKDPHGNGRMALSCANEQDRTVMAAICDAVTERSACICCLVLTAGLLLSGAGRDPKRPVFITAEGSTYLKQKDFKEKLQRHMEEFAGAKYGLHFEFHVVPDVILKGIAVACLSQN